MYRPEEEVKPSFGFAFTMERIKAVIFDWGGVLIDDPRPGLMLYCAKALGVSEADYTRAHNKFSEEFQKGLISENVFWAGVCAELKTSRPKAPSLWSDAFRSVYLPRKEMFSLASKLHKNGYKTAVLSNTEAPAMQFFYQLRYNMFDVVVFSCVERTKKPEREIYELTIQRLKTRPRQAVFIDDRPEYINGAKEVGLNTIVFKSGEQVKDELARFSVAIG